MFLLRAIVICQQYFGIAVLLSEILRFVPSLVMGLYIMHMCTFLLLQNSSSVQRLPVL